MMPFAPPALRAELEDVAVALYLTLRDGVVGDARQAVLDDAAVILVALELLATETDDAPEFVDESEAQA